jgi:nucleotide-binding universal stress UspA family protein
MVERGDPKDVICKAVEDLGVNVLAVGSRGLSKLERFDFVLAFVLSFLFALTTLFCRFFLGSVSRYCIEHANCQLVLVARENKK